MDESDDDVGPMPMPEGASEPPKKKRKGLSIYSVFPNQISFLFQCFLMNVFTSNTSQVQTNITSLSCTGM